jgi:hypothetical protein
VRWGAPAAVLLTLIGLWAAVPDALIKKKAFSVAETGTRSDREVILAPPLPPDRLRLWMYRSVVPARGRLFLLSFIGIYDLMKETVAVQGPELFMSPWHSSLRDPTGRFADMKDLPWQIIVVDKGSLGWIDKSAHP